VRLFVAVFPPEPAVTDLQSLVSRLHLGTATAAGHNVGLDAPERWHLTLAFLGEVDDARVGEVESALSTVAEKWPRDHANRPPLRVADGGRFNSGASTIMWAGLHGDVSSLADLTGRVGKELSRAGLLTDERRPFRPHLTLARCGDRMSADEIAADLGDLHGYAGPSWTVNELVLVRSHLGPDRRYERLRTWSLT
jgi:2'-5' RNA ligase